MFAHFFLQPSCHYDMHTFVKFELIFYWVYRGQQQAHTYTKRPTETQTASKKLSRVRAKLDLAARAFIPGAILRLKCSCRVFVCASRFLFGFALAGLCRCCRRCCCCCDSGIYAALYICANCVPASSALAVASSSRVCVCVCAWRGILFLCPQRVVFKLFFFVRWYFRILCSTTVQCSRFFTIPALAWRCACVWCVRVCVCVSAFPYAK